MKGRETRENMMIILRKGKKKGRGTKKRQNYDEIGIAIIIYIS